MVRQRSCTFGGGVATRGVFPLKSRVSFPLGRCAFCRTPPSGGRSFLRFPCTGALPPPGAERGGGDSFGGRCCCSAAHGNSTSASVHSNPPNWRLVFIRPTSV